MKKTKLTRSLLAACSIVALSVVVYGCDSGPSQSEYDDVKAQADANAEAAAAAAAAQAEAEAAAAAAAAEAAASAAAAAEAEAAKTQAEADAAVAAARQADAEADAAEAAARQAEAEAAQAEAQAAQAMAEAARAEAQAAQAEAETRAAEAEAARAAAEAAQMEAEMGQDTTQGELDARDAAAASAKAAALKAALGTMPLSNLIALTAAQPTGTDNVVVPSLVPAGLMLGMPARNADGSISETPTGEAPTGGGTAAARTPRMATGDSAGMLGDWAGTDYASTHPVTGVTHSARAYRNNAAGVMTPFATGATFGADEAAFDAAYVRSTRTLNLGTPANNFDIAAAMFPAAGTTTYTGTADATDVLAVVFPGTYQGAEGNFHCGGTTACEATRNANGSITLAGTWDFVHVEGAMVSHDDGNYLYFGWWLNTDGTGTPARASAFTGTVGTLIAAPATAPSALTGSATYAGHAAGKFAISNPIGSDSAGHFTADASLTAVFGGVSGVSGLSGTIDNFRLNDADMEPDDPWSVTLAHRDWNAAADATTAGWWMADVGYDDPSTAATDEATNATLWRIADAPADASGSWSAMMYDEDPTDGNATPTSLTGTFQSHYGEFLTMVGAFGAERE